MEHILAPCGSEAARAEALIAEFGSLAAAAAGSRARQLRALQGDEAAFCRLRQFRAAMMHVLRHRVAARPLLSNWRALLAYLQADMACLSTERVRVLHLDVRNQLIRDEVASWGTIDAAHIEVREVMARALELGSAALLLVHNHPSGVLEPSQADIRITRSIIAAGQILGIALHDHLIIGRDGHTSMRARGLI